MKKFLLSALIVLLIVVFAYAAVANVIRPFAVAFMFVLAVTPVSKFVPVVTLILIELWRCPEQLNMISVIFASGVFLLTALVIRFIKGKKRWYLPVLLGGFVLSQGINLYVALIHFAVLPQTLIAVLIGDIFLLASCVCVKAITQKKFVFPWTIDQIVSLMCLVVIFALGLSGFENLYFDVYKFCSLLAILWGVFYVNPKSTVMLAAALGLGKAFATTDLSPVAIMVLLSIVCVVFKSKQRIYSIVGLLMGDLVPWPYRPLWVVRKRQEKCRSSP